MGLTAERTLEIPPGKNPPMGDALRRRISVRRSSTSKIFVMVTMALILAVGIFLRVYPSAGFKRIGRDEHAYMVFLKQIEIAGVPNYDAVVRVYVERQYKQPDAVVPATRIGFLAPAYFFGKLLHLSSFNALRATNCGAGILMLVLSGWFAYRIGGTRAMLGTAALVATAPLQIYLSQRALIDGYFAFWAMLSLWLAWENLQRPRRWGWLTAYTLSLAVLVLTKENAAFVVVAIFGVLLSNRWLRLGTLSPQLLVATLLGPTLALMLLAGMVGGVWEWARFYQMFVAKSRTNFYSIFAQDGPWYRYLVDFVLMSPLVVVLAIGRIFQLRKADRAEVFMTAFLVLNFIFMASVTYGMSLRYAAYWDMLLCVLASSQILSLSRKFPKVRSTILASGLILIVGMTGLSQYYRFFIKGEVYDPVTAALVRVADLQKSAQRTAAPQSTNESTKFDRFPVVTR
jgi:Dolichyl-phosphate-mannose-protein mannosyltransferase